MRTLKEYKQLSYSTLEMEQDLLRERMYATRNTAKKRKYKNAIKRIEQAKHDIKWRKGVGIE